MEPGSAPRHSGAHVGVVNVSAKKCEGCGVKRPSFGLPSEGKKARWCASCAKAHVGVVGVKRKCEGCGLKQPSFGLSSEGKKVRWCAG